MLTGPHFRPAVLQAKKRLQEGRSAAQAAHAAGQSGQQIGEFLADLFDEILLLLCGQGADGPAVDNPAMQEAAAQGSTALCTSAPSAAAAPVTLPANVALVALGGFARRDLSPYSDVDLMILATSESSAGVEALAGQLVRDVFDVGLTLGQSVRTPAEACKQAAKDVVICTSLMDTRFLAGNRGLYEGFEQQFKKQIRKNAKSWIEQLERARAEERLKFGGTVYLLEPNLKRSHGGLRDLHFLRWLGFTRFGSPEPARLFRQGLLLEDDLQTLEQAKDFLLRVRHELHFKASRANDVLSRSEQWRMAAAFGYADEPGLLAVELFMRDYFRHSNGLRVMAQRFLDFSRPRSPWERLLSPWVTHQFEGDLRVGPRVIQVASKVLDDRLLTLAEILRLLDVCNLYDKHLGQDTILAVRRSAAALSDHLTPEAAQRFLSIMSQPARLGELLRFLHETMVLEKVIPAMAHARNLLQFNEYHKYTVDEHSLRAVERATEFSQETGPLGEVYRELKRKWMLHLALLLHDLGKGQEGDHSDVGLEIARQTAQRLGLSAADTETLCFLVHKHLMMSHLALRRDVSDGPTVLRFAVEVGTPERLQMLFLLSAADIGAVGPGVWTDWKAQFLSELYHRALQHLAGDRPSFHVDERMRSLRDKVRHALGPLAKDDWFARHVEQLPASYLVSSLAAQVADDLRGLKNRAPGTVFVQGRYTPGTHTVQYSVGTDESVTQGVFSKIAGALSCKRLQIVSAEITTLHDGLVLDRFVVVDPDHAGEPPPGRIQEICQAVTQALLAPANAKPPVMPKYWSAQAGTIPKLVPTRVEIDNSHSERYTTIDVFAADRPGLLYTITRTLYELELSVGLAKIATHLDQVLDVFYVTDKDGHKLEDESRLQTIRNELLKAIESMRD